MQKFELTRDELPIVSEVQEKSTHSDKKYAIVCVDFLHKYAMKYAISIMKSNLTENR